MDTLKLDTDKTTIGEMFETFVVQHGAVDLQTMEDALNYGVFAHNGVYWRHKQGNSHHLAISNFTLEITSLDKVVGKKYISEIKLTNHHGFTSTVKIDSAQVKSRILFSKAILVHGKFVFKGESKEYKKLIQMMIDKYKVI